MPQSITGGYPGPTYSAGPQPLPGPIPLINKPPVPGPGPIPLINPYPLTDPASFANRPIPGQLGTPVPPQRPGGNLYDTVNALATRFRANTPVGSGTAPDPTYYGIPPGTPQGFDTSSPDQRQFQTGGTPWLGNGTQPGGNAGVGHWGPDATQPPQPPQTTMPTLNSVAQQSQGVWGGNNVPTWLQAMNRLKQTRPGFPYGAGGNPWQ